MMLQKVRSWISKDTYSTFVFLGTTIPDDVKRCLKTVTNKRLSENDARLLTETFGKRFRKMLSLDDTRQISVTYIYSAIHPDDNISWMKRKLYSHLHNQANQQMDSHGDIYLWVNKQLPVSQYTLQTFITNVFKHEKTISFKDFHTYAKNYFGVSIKDPQTQFVDKNLAIALINNIDVAKFAEPLCFKYTNDIYFEYINYNPLDIELNIDVSSLNMMTQDSLLLESFGIDSISDDCINLLTFNNFKKFLNAQPQPISTMSKQVLFDKYFPEVKTSNTKEYHTNTLKFIASIEDTEEAVYAKMSNNINTKQNIGSYVNFLHLRVNELNFNAKQDLERMFENFTTSAFIPFIKLKSFNNNYYKVYKDTITSTGFRNNLQTKWTEQTNISSGKVSDTSYIQMKIQYTKDIYCTLVVFDNLCYDVKFSFGSSMRETQHNVVVFMDNIDMIIKRIREIYPSLYIPFVDRRFFNNVSGNDETTKILRWLTTNSIKSENTIIKFGNFQNVIQTKMSSFFNIIKNPNKNILHLQYKKVDNYLKYENIQVFISNNYTKDKDEMLRRITTEFVMTKDDAEKELEKWLSQNEMRMFVIGDKIFMKTRNDNFVNVKIKLSTSIDLNFNIEGVRNNNLHERIVNLLVVLIGMAQEKVEKIKIIETSKVDSIVFGFSATKSAKHLENTEDFDLDEELGAYEEFGDLFEDDDELKALEAEFLRDAIAQPNDKQSKADQNEGDDTAELDGVSEDDMMKSYFMNMLKSADRELIDYKVPKGDKSQKRYSTVCQWNDRRQPVVVNKTEFDKVQQYNKNIKYVKTGSTPDLQEKNFYICPQVWCPKSKIALTYKDFKEKYNESCPDPSIQEKPILLTNHYWGKGEKGMTREHFPGFLDAFTHPKKLCLPCCFKKEAKLGSKNMQKENMCKNQWNTIENDEEMVEVVGNEKYIKADIVVPLETSRFGLLPKEISNTIKNNYCGNGLDGKGLMNDKTDCILRKGVNQKSQSFLNALILLLDNPAISSVQSFIDMFNKHASVEQFIGLENGKILKLFINKEYDIYMQENFATFIQWFLKQSSYIKKFRLFDVAKELAVYYRDNPKGSFDTKTLKTHKSILREFLIFNAYTHFLQYVSDQNVEKNYQFLIDFVQTETNWLNINHYNVIVIEHDISENKTFMVCPFNRDARNAFEYTDPFIIILKQNNYYEPLYHVKVSNGDLQTTSAFLFKHAPKGIKKMIRFYMQNCSLDELKVSSHDIDVILQTLGYTVKYYVIDYTFRVCGYLLQSNNLFVPIKDKVDVNSLNAEFIYYDEISKYRCSLTAEQIEEVFYKLYKRTKDTFYKLHTIIKSFDDTRIVGVFINEDYFVPVNYHENEDLKYISDILQDDLNIFIDAEILDARKARIQKDLERRKQYQQLVHEINAYINKHPDIKKEIEFIMDKSNPFPKEYLRNQMLKIVKRITKDSDITNTKGRFDDLMKITSQYVEELFQASGNTQNLMLRQLFGLKKKFKKAAYELFFDQRDVIDGKLAEKIKVLQNPYVSLIERLDRHLKEYVYEERDFDELQYFRRYINQSTIYEDVPYKFRKILTNHLLVTYNKYTPNTIYDIFLMVCKTRQLTQITDTGMLREVVYQSISQSYKESHIEMLVSNPSFIYNEKLMKLKKRTLDTIIQTVDSMMYYPSFYELFILSKIAKINVIIIGRKNKENMEGVEMYFNNSSKYIMFEHSYDRFNYYDVLKLVLKDPKGKSPKLILRKHEVNVKIMELLNGKQPNKK
jgi:hypothetical protein